jgi:hypothetical protein
MKFKYLNILINHYQNNILFIYFKFWNIITNPNENDNGH